MDQLLLGGIIFTWGFFLVCTGITIFIGMAGPLCKSEYREIPSDEEEQEQKRVLRWFGFQAVGVVVTVLTVIAIMLVVGGWLTMFGSAIYMTV